MRDPREKLDDLHKETSHLFTRKCSKLYLHASGSVYRALLEDECFASIQFTEKTIINIMIASTTIIMLPSLATWRRCA